MTRSELNATSRRARVAERSRRARVAFRRWRRGRPFWGGLLTILSALQIFVSTQLTLGGMQVRIGMEGFQSILIPVILGLAGLLIWLMPAHRVFYGVITLVVAVYSLIGVNLGGFFIGLILGVLGGSLAVAWTPRNAAAAETEHDTADDAGPDDTPSDDATLQDDVDDGTDDEEPETVPVDDLLNGGTEDRGRPATRVALVVGVLSPFLAIFAVAAPGTAGAGTESSSDSAEDDSLLDWLLPDWPGSDPSPTESPTATHSPPPSPDPTAEPTDPGSPSPTGTPSPTGDPTSPPDGSPSPTSDPTENPEPTENPTDDPTGTPEPTETPTSFPFDELEGEPTAEPRAVETPEKLVAEEPGHLTGSRITMTGLSYDGVVELSTAGGSIRTLQFSMDKSVIDDFSLLSPSKDGHDLLTLSSQLTVAGDVKFYTDRFSGTLLGIPLTFTPDSPPPLTLPVMVFGDPDINLVNVISGTLTAENMRQSFPD